MFCRNQTIDLAGIIRHFPQQDVKAIGIRLTLSMTYDAKNQKNKEQ
jgi:hypothetical protein